MTEVESEFGLSLTEKGYEHLKKEMNWQEKSKRSDFYFDVLDNKSFLLSKNTRLKWRLKVNDEAIKAEVSQLKSQVEIADDDILLRVSTRASSHGGTKKKSLEKLYLEAEELVNFLSLSSRSVHADQLKLRAKGFNKELMRLGFFPELIANHLSNSPSSFALPAYWNRKKRRGITIEFDHTDLAIFIEKKSLLDRKGNQIYSYALEAEPENTLEPKVLQQTGIELIQFLREFGLEGKHMNTVSPDPWAFTGSRISSAKALSR